MTPTNFVPSGRNEVIVRVYSYQGKCPKGVVSGPRLEKPAAFSSLVQLLLMLEELMDRGNQPQRSAEPRTFQKNEGQLFADGAMDGEPVATFRLSVLFRQNASWQGTLLWADKSLDAQFRSALELIRLMDSALSTLTDTE